MEELINITSESLERFLTRWYGNPNLPITIQPTATIIPHALKHWHEVTSQWSTPMATFNHPLKPSEMEIEDGKLVFWIENQGTWTWSTNTDSDDPIVYDRQTSSDPEPWIPTGETLSEFLLHATVFEALTGAENQIQTENITKDELTYITREFQILPLAQWRWPAHDVKILVGPNLLAQASESLFASTHKEDVRFDVSFAAPKPDLLIPLSETTTVTWRYYTKNEPKNSSWDDLPDFLK